MPITITVIDCNGCNRWCISESRSISKNKHLVRTLFDSVAPSSSYRELRSAHDFIVLKRLEEKNRVDEQRRVNVDHQLRSFQLRYQISRQVLSIQQSRA